MYFLCDCGKMVSFTPIEKSENIEDVKCPACKQSYYYMRHAKCLVKAGMMNDVRKAWGGEKDV